MTRKECYNYIKENKLQDTIKEFTGKNFTNCSTDVLETYINNITSSTPKVSNPADTVCKCSTPVIKLMEVLTKKHILLPSEVKCILN